MTLVEELRETWRILQREPLLEVAADRIHDLEAERAELLDRIEELEKAFLMVARNFAKASARIEELEKQFLARTGQAAKEET